MGEMLYGIGRSLDGVVRRRLDVALGPRLGLPERQPRQAMTAPCGQKGATERGQVRGLLDNLDGDARVRS
jgi:hypothetical protein